jgi:hypothetical protein
LEWDYAEAHLALAQLYDTAEKRPDGDRHLAEALARRVFYAAGTRYAARRILALKTPGRFLDNALIDFCIDPQRTDVDVLYITDDLERLPELEPYAAIYNTISEREEHRDAIARCIDLLAPVARSVINHPRYLGTVARTRLCDTLRGVPGAFALPVLRLTREALAAADDSRSPLRTIDLPVLLRPVDAQRGDGLERIDTPGGLTDYARRTAATHLYLTPFVDYRSPDGYYRKYRVVVVDGVPFPYHLAISEQWLVHYWRTQPLMRIHAWMRDEELRFLQNPETVFPTWTATFGGIARATGLDVFVVDCTILPAGVLVFECDPSGFVHCRDAPDGVFAYKYEYVPRIFGAIDELITARASEGL